MVARISVKIIFEEFLQRYPQFHRVQEQLPWMPSTTFRSPMKLDLAVD
jgi:cytochrome P450